MTQEPKIFPYIAKLLNGAKVEWKPLGEVLLSVKTGLNPRHFFTLNTENAKNYYITIRELRGGKIIPSDKTDKMNDEALKLCQKRSNLEVGDILFSGTGTIGEMAIIKEDPTNWNIKEGVYSLKPNLSIVTSGYICHILNSQEIKNKILNKSVGGTVKSIPMKELQQIQIPLPPLSVQQEIVRILDIFTQLEAELEAELDCRKRQYEYYRNALLSFDDLENRGYNSLINNKIQYKTLGEVAEYEQPTKYLVKSSNYNDAYSIPVLTAGKTFILGYTNEIEGVYKASVNPVIIFDDFTTANKWVDFDFKAKSSAMKMITSKNDKEVLLKYIYYWLNTLPSELIEGDHKRQWISNYANKKIPIPSIEEQERIVAILDKFDTLVNSISEGLPKEIQQRRQQYEYYREQLLTF